MQDYSTLDKEKSTSELPYILKSNRGSRFFKRKENDPLRFLATSESP